jgi:tRNA(Ile)-lysidine synthase
MHEDLKKYCQLKKVEWVEDPMNDDEDFARVKIRKFLPNLKRIGINEERLAETAKSLQNSRLFIQSLIDDFLSSQVRWWEGVLVSLNYAKLKKLHVEVAKGVVGCLLQKVGQTDYLPEASEIMRFLTTDDFKGCTLGKCELFIASKRLWIIPQDEKNELMKKNEWAMFAEKYPQYKNYGLPYKVRRALKQKIGLK